MMDRKNTYSPLFRNNIARFNLCRVCGFRVRVWESYRTSGSFGYGYGSVTELTEVTGNVARSHRTHREVPGGYKKCRTRTPGIVARDVQNSRKLRVRVWKSCRTSRSSGYCGTGVQNLQKFRAGVKMVYPYPGYCSTVVQILHKFRVPVWMTHRTHRSSLYGYGCCTELTKVPGTGNTRVNTRPRGRSSI